MAKFCPAKVLWLILFWCWSSDRVLSEGMFQNTFQNSSTNQENMGFTYFYYQQPDYPRDCMEARYRCSTSDLSGVHLIKPDGYPKPFEVYCDNTVDSGGWTVILRIQDGSILFNRNWTEYKNGFGFLSQEFWLGNNKLSFLTNQNSYELLIDVTTNDNTKFFISYNRFYISDENGEYKLASVGEYKGAEDNITTFLCPSNREGVIYVLPDCSRGCSCRNGQLSCDGKYQCTSNAVCEETNNVTRCYCKEGYEGDGINCTAIPPSDCKDVYERISTRGGVYKIKPTTWEDEPFDVYCNMTDGGGWTVFQRRVNGSQPFFLFWSDYKVGFGTPSHEMWLGNDKLHSLTTQSTYEIRIDVVDSSGDPYYAKYTPFSIANETDNYRLSVGDYTEGDAGNDLKFSNGQPFTTRDRDNDNWTDGNCATFYAYDYCGSRCRNNGAWWYKRYNKCSLVHINSPYASTCFRWYTLSGTPCNITYTEMKVRPI